MPLWFWIRYFWGARDMTEAPPRPGPLPSPRAGWPMAASAGSAELPGSPAGPASSSGSGPPRKAEWWCSSVTSAHRGAGRQAGK